MIKISMFQKKTVGNLRAFFSVDLGTKLVIRDCKLIEGKNGIFAAMPSRQYEHNGQTKWTNIVQILDQSLLEEIQEAALKEYHGGSIPPSQSNNSDDDSDLPF